MESSEASESTDRSSDLDLAFMREAILEAHKASRIGEVPVGAVVVHNGEIIARAHNRRTTDHDPTAHAELIAIRDAAKVLGDWRLEDCTVYVTLEPCPMCAGTMVLGRVARCVYGCVDPKAGYMGSLADLSRDERLNHRFPVTPGVLAEECGDLLRNFFREIRRKKKAARKAARAQEVLQSSSGVSKPDPTMK